MKSRLNSFGLPIIIAIFIFYGLSQFWAAFIGIQYHFGTGWALGALALAIFARFTLPITIGAFFGAMDVWGWSWLISFLFAAPGLAYMAITLSAVVFSKSFSVRNYFKRKKESLDINNSKNDSNRSDGFSQTITTVLVLFSLIILFSFLYNKSNDNNIIKEFPDRSNNADGNKSYNQSTTPVDEITSVTNNSINNSEKPFNTSFNNREFSDASNSAVKKETPKNIKNNSSGSAKTSRYVLHGPTKVIRIPMNREVKIYKSPNIKDSAYIISEGKYKAVISDLVYYDKNDRQWIMIEINNNQGWVSEDFLNSWFNAQQKGSPSPSPSRGGK